MIKALALAALLSGAALAQGVVPVGLLGSGAGGGGAAPVVETTAVGTDVTNGTGATHVAPSGLASGDYLALFMGLDDGNNNNAYACPGTAEYTLATSSISNLVSSYHCYKASNPGSDSLTSSWTGSETGRVAAARISGVSAVGTPVTTPTGATDTPTCPAVAYTAPATVICVCAFDGGGSPTISSGTGDNGWTVIRAIAQNGTGGAGLVVEYQAFTSGTTTSAESFTLSVSEDWACSAVAYEG